MFTEFKAFIALGNVLDLAVGVIIGAGFGKIVTSLTDDMLMPAISAVTGGGVDYSNKYFVLAGTAPAGATLAAAKQAGATVLAYGSFATAVINFLILAFVIFLIGRQANRLLPAPPAAPAGPSEVELLTQIRDALNK